MAALTDKINPYVIGSPIHEPKFFFGRKSLFEFVKDNLNQRAQVILLHGQRRIGKSSVLAQIRYFIGEDKFAFVYFDLQDKNAMSVGAVLHRLGKEIIERLELQLDRIELPSVVELENNTEIFSEEFLRQVEGELEDKNLVLLLDEFDVLNNYNPNSAKEHFFPYLQSLISRHEGFFIIPVVGRRVEDMPKLLSLFRRAPQWEIGLLDDRSTRQLIVEPAVGVLEYEEEAIAAIVELAAGHPYFTQAICFAVFGEARQEDRWQVSRADVEKVADKAIESVEGGLQWFRDGLPIPERVVFSAVAEGQKIAAAKGDRVEGEPISLLKEYGVVETEALIEAGGRLVEWGFLELADSISPRQRFPRYKVIVELVRRWLVKRYPLRDEIWELEKVSSEASRLYELGTEFAQNKVFLKNALNLYEQVLEINPNHFKTLFELGEGYLEVEDFKKAAAIYQRSYKVNPIRGGDGLVESLLGYGSQLIEEGKAEARERFREVLAIESDNEIAREKLREIEADKEVLDLYRLFQASNPAKTLEVAKSEDRQYYINFSAVRPSLTERLSRQIARSPNLPTCQLFTGHIGCGKSTELLRLKTELELQGFHVVYFEATEDLDMEDVDVTDIFLAIARHVSKSLEEIRINLKPTGFKNFLQQIAELLNTPIDVSGIGDTSVSFSLPVGIGRITAKIEDRSKLRSQIREELDDSSRMVELINKEVLEPAIEQLKQRGKQGLVIIVDNLDRLLDSPKSSVRNLPEYLFIDQGKQLLQLSCHVVYTIPLKLIFSKEFFSLKNRFGVEPEVLPMAAVRLPDGRECQEGVALMRQMVLARAFPEVDEVLRLDLITKIFDTPETLDRLCKISGGHVRNLLGILRRCLLQENPPISRECLEKVIKQIAYGIAIVIDNNEWELLRQVRERKTIAGEYEYQVLLRSLFLFEYEYGGDRWFDINPVLAETKEYRELVKDKSQSADVRND